MTRVDVAAFRQLLPPASRHALRRAVRRVRHLGLRRHCPVCGARCRAFLPDARTGRPDSACPVCGSRERHRALWPFLVEATPLVSARPRLLHVAPEPCLERRLRGIGLRGYATLDLARRDVGLRADLERLPFAAASFDAILCNHVLEHVGDDRAALRELARVLAPGGFAVLTVPGPDPALGFPSALARTVEDDDARSPEARLRRFGHPGHLRQYGRDFSDRLADAGLPATRFDWGAELPPSTKTRRALFPSYPIYLCRRETKGETKGTLLR